jgi:hypothetical protein
MYGNGSVGAHCIFLSRNLAMALFFQLLSERELAELSAEELETLKAAFYHALYNDPTIRRQLGGKVSETIDRLRAQRQTPNPDSPASA